MKQFIYTVAMLLVFTACNTKDTPTIPERITDMAKSLAYPYKATYSSDISAPAHPENAQKVLTVWKMFETMQFDEMKKYYADTVTYDAGGHRFHGSAAALLAYAQKDVETLDSLRFDISAWQSVHINDKNEDWVYIWAAERRYEKNGKADTTLIHEQWQVKDNKVVYFNLYSNSHS